MLLSTIGATCRDMLGILCQLFFHGVFDPFGVQLVVGLAGLATL